MSTITREHTANTDSQTIAIDVMIKRRKELEDLNNDLQATVGKLQAAADKLEEAADDTVSAKPEAEKEPRSEATENLTVTTLTAPSIAVVGVALGAATVVGFLLGVAMGARE